MRTLSNIASIVPSQGDHSASQQAAGTTAPAIPFADMLDNLTLISEVTPKEHNFTTAGSTTFSSSLKSQKESPAPTTAISPTISKTEKTIEKANNSGTNKNAHEKEALQMYDEKSYANHRLEMPKFIKNNEFSERSSQVSLSDVRFLAQPEEPGSDDSHIIQNLVSVTPIWEESVNKQDFTQETPFTIQPASTALFVQPFTTIPLQKPVSEASPVLAEDAFVRAAITADTSDATKTNMPTLEHQMVPQSMAQLLPRDRDPQPIATVEVRQSDYIPLRVEIPLSILPHAVSLPHPLNTPLMPPGQPSFMSQNFVSSGESSDGCGLLDYQNESKSMFQGIAAGKVGASINKQARSTASTEKAMTTEMVDRIKNLLKEQQRYDMKVTIHHAEYGLITMNLRFSQHSKHVNATFLSDNDDLLKILSESNQEISDVFQDEGLTCQQQVRRK